MAKVCKCHERRAAAVARGMDWHEANRRHSKPGYHEHACECPCGCTHDTLGWALCPACSHNRDCWAKRGQVGITLLGLPVMGSEQ